MKSKIPYVYITAIGLCKFSIKKKYKLGKQHSVQYKGKYKLHKGCTQNGKKWIKLNWWFDEDQVHWK